MKHCKQFWRLHLALPLLLALLLLLVYPRTGLDTWLIEPYYNVETFSFPLKEDAFFESFMHQGLKNAMVAVGLMMLGLWLLGFKLFSRLQMKSTWIKTYHQQFLWVFVAMVISTSVISLLKHFSEHACPWSLQMYGGTQPFIPLFGSLPIGAVAGHCFPGGHASGGFALWAFYFGFRDAEPKLAELKLARLGLFLALCFGFAMGWSQMMRGAHFMSHNLWTAWIVWMILLLQYVVWSPARRAL